MAVSGDIPRISSAVHTHTIYDGMGSATGGTASSNSLTGTRGISGGAGLQFIGDCSSDHFESQYLQRQKESNRVTLLGPAIIKEKQEPQVTKSKRRIVQVFIADPNENVPLDDAMIYRGNQHLTDATDQELFFELNINDLLKAHNAKRVKMVDKSVKDRVEYLEPVKIRDLRMVVINIAEF